MPIQGDTGGYSPPSGQGSANGGAMPGGNSPPTLERNWSNVHPVLNQWMGWRVEVLYYGEVRRFNIGRSTGIAPVTLGLHNRSSMGSSHVLTPDNCTFLRAIRRVR
jgi:hypothetical protein